MGITSSQQPPKTEVKGYLQAGMNFAKMPKAITQGDLGVKAGVQVEKKAFHAGAEAGIGTGLLQMRMEAGHKFDLNNKWDLDLTGKAEYKKQLGSPNSYISEQSVKLDNLPPVNALFIDTWAQDEIRLGVKAEAQYSTGRFKLGAGIEGGYRANTLGDIYERTHIDGIVNDTVVKYDSESRFDRGDKGAYITPTLSAEYNVGKGVSFLAKGDLMQGEAGIRWTF